jgi:hypothetical protein
MRIKQETERSDLNVPAVKHGRHVPLVGIATFGSTSICGVIVPAVLGA